jgi:protein-disulfide isomerase
LKTLHFANRLTRGMVVGLSLLILPLLLACGGGEESVQTQVSKPDTVLGAILESALESQRTPRSTSPRISQDNQANQPIQIAEMGYNFGSGDAPVKVMEISDFGCGYCRRFHEETFPDLLEIYMDAGFVEWKFIPFVLGMFPNGLQAATAGECAGEQDLFFPMQDRLFADQSGWRNSDDPYGFFSILAEEEGLDVTRFNSCIEGGWRDNQVRANIRLGQQAGVRGTPLFIIDGRPLPGAVPLADFRTLLDTALQQRGVTPPPQ